jgi:hypothetical protein
MRSSLVSVQRRTGVSLFGVVAALSIAACGSTTTPSIAPVVPSLASEMASATPRTSTVPSADSSSPSDGPSASTLVSAPFAFPADSVIAFYEGEGLSCAAPIPSTKAAGWTLRTCQGLDAAGRPIAVGVVTDPDGRLGDGFASVTALPGADLLEPTDALELLSGFLGAMLGEGPATDLLPWLASHLGDTYAETTFRGGTIATYTESADDPTRIYLEVANPSYVSAPPP